ncbi:hypothetical protein TVAG_489510 [Trichomonas vaginalis G3]|uniref:Uncharacterized protein n=1 Tax=Trichomonas vaginalis (strain ATCC PRA-98 / G3) TaxID=412133 RepID=A2FEI7_TRIV3|nr:hypothetical protein TVAGG3_0878250 [Trichomonas vaginalis G3]EAX96669.1 hypothetical protein TVAG_489510 [Trichomonas vaginalis G3]KAI5501848.1 hypothetical protein TVAGG3_0878250 [Trichomonas vaginalis G3]|eukprot:XP_001309599.1 hypothetical protein [Trichomonas vaginalis G3]
MSDVPLPECLPKPEEPKAAEPQQSPQQPQFQQVPPNYYQFQYKSKRDQEFEEGLNRLRKEYATAPIERKLLLNSVKIMFR